MEYAGTLQNDILYTDLSDLFCRCCHCYTEKNIHLKLIINTAAGKRGSGLYGG